MQKYKLYLDDILDSIKYCEQLNGVYIETRYVSIGKDIPSKKFNKKNSSEFLEMVKEIMNG